MPAGLEIELKLRAEDDGPLIALAGAARLGRFTLGPAHVVDELDRYLDTADGRLAAARWACRLRSRDGTLRVSLKGPAEHGAGDPFHRRPEEEGQASGSAPPETWPASAARDMLLELSDGQPLRERLALRQQRTERGVSAESALGTLSLDRVTVLRAGEQVGQFLAVELELRPDAIEADTSQELLRELASIRGLEPEPRSKLERALAMLDHSP